MVQKHFQRFKKYIFEEKTPLDVDGAGLTKNQKKHKKGYIHELFS